jgi:hypothetical protein
MIGNRKSAFNAQVGMTLVLAMALGGFTAVVVGQSQPEHNNAAPTPKAILVDGQPALSLDYGDGMGFLIVYTKFHDKPVFRFSISHPGPGIGRVYECGGYLWVAKDEIAYTSDPAANQKTCVHHHSATGMRVAEEFDLPRTHFSDLEVSAGGIELNVISKTSDLPDGFDWANFVHNVAPDKRWLPNDKNGSAQPNEMNAAQKLAAPWLQEAFDNFPDAERNFFQATAGIPRPLTTEQISTVGSAEKAAEASEQAGNLQAAFDAYVSAVANLPPNATGEQVDSLREHMLRLVPRLSSAPAIPEEAKRHLAFALAAMSDWKTSGDAGKLSEAVDELNKVARLAPWRPEAYFNLGVVLEGQNQYEAAARNYKLYLLAAPNAPDADAVQQKIYQLEYKSGAR